MIIKENIKDVTIANTKISKILSGGGIIWEKEKVYRIEWTLTSRKSVPVKDIEREYRAYYKVQNGIFIAYGNIYSAKEGKEYYSPNGISKCIIKRLIGDQCAVEYYIGRIIYED